MRFALLWVPIVTASDYSIQLRRAILPILKADTRLAAMTGGRIYSETPPAIPAWPFIRYGHSISTPQEWTCSTGANITFTINAFSKAAGTDECGRMVRLICAALDGKSIPLEIDTDSGESAEAVMVFVTQTQIMRDGDEADAHHGVVSFEAMVSG